MLLFVLLPFPGDHALFSGFLNIEEISTYLLNDEKLPFSFYKILLYSNFHIVQIEFNLSVLFNLLNFHMLIYFFTVFQLILIKMLLWNLKVLTHVILKMALWF